MKKVVLATALSLCVASALAIETMPEGLNSIIP